MALALLAITALVASGCAEEPVAPMPNPGSVQRPAVGSTFTYRELLVDRDNAEVPGS